MRNLSVSINDTDFERLGFKDTKISFSELKEKLSIEYAREAMLKCQKIAEESGLSEMTIAEINKEIHAVRDESKNRT